MFQSILTILMELLNNSKVCIKPQIPGDDQDRNTLGYDKLCGKYNFNFTACVGGLV